LWKTTVKGPEIYDAAKEGLDMAIREYEQAVMHLTACIVAGKLPCFFLISGNKYRQDLSEKTKQDKEFMEWLSPSHWLVESQLYGLRQKRTQGTLHWAHALDEFQDWRLSETKETSKERVLWLYGTLGIGKSTIAGYLIDLLKCQYPNSMVGYFFCRSHQTGLTKVIDIIRTLSYQFLGEDKEMRAVLEALKSRDFRISDGLEVGLLFEKLLLEPLQRAQKDVYIILDGLDEADSDETERKRLRELLTCLTRLPSSRLLFISRPSPDISSFLPMMVKRYIGMSENTKDIVTYVEERLCESETLRKLFKSAHVDPEDYFRKKANGIFLWVDLVMQQLAKVKSVSLFQKCLQGFSEASGSMEKLYTNILSKVGEDDRPWISEIVRWVVMGVTPMKELELKNAVEFTLQDSLVNFTSFLEVECGTMLSSRTSARQLFGYIHPIHETFRTFVLTRDRCPPWIFIDEKASHGSLALNCLSRLVRSDIDISLDKYCLKSWAAHLSMSSANDQSAGILLITLHDFFVSKISRWLIHLRQSDYVEGPFDSLQISFEESYLEKVYTWLQEAQACDLTARAGFSNDEISWSVSVDWLHNVLSNPSVLGEALGKAAARLWFYNELQERQCILMCFRLGLKYYWKRENRVLSNVDELAELISNKFQGISHWAGGSENHVVTKKNMGFAYFFLRQWGLCTGLLNQARVEATVDLPDATYHLGLASMINHDYTSAIAMFRAVLSVESVNHMFTTGYLLIRAYTGKGDYEKATKLFENASEEQREEMNESVALALYEALLEMDDYEGASRVFRDVTKREARPHTAVPYYYLNLQGIRGDYDGMIRTCLHYNVFYIFDHYILNLIGLGKSSKAIELCRLAIKMSCDLGLGLKPVDNSLMIGLIGKLPVATTSKQQEDQVLECLENALRLSQGSGKPVSSTIFKIHKKMGNYNGAVRAFENSTYSEMANHWSSEELVEVFNAVGKYESLVKTVWDRVDLHGRGFRADWAAKLGHIHIAAE
jgi:tetratricopeptide (TPR) repeat protein